MNIQQSNRRWHWFFWIIYGLINHIIFSPDYFSITSLNTTVLFLVHNAGTAYVVLDWWIPKFYRKGKYGLFILSTIGTIIFFGSLLSLSLIASYKIIGDFQPDLNLFIQEFGVAAFFSNLSGIGALVIPYFILQRKEMERRNQKLEKEKLEAELKLLKSQLHPHFLFNALNNIYFLIKKDPDTAAEALAGFSNLLRFQLYEANNPQVLLEKEIEYLQQFAEIAQLRKGENFKVNWQLPKKTNGITIAPLLLMPALENAFKHGSNKNGRIDIQIEVDNAQLHFNIANTKEQNKSKGLNGFEEGGIGLANIQKRLALIYPKKHQLNIEDLPDEFVVDLKLDLN